MLTKPLLQYPLALDEKNWTARYLMHPVSEALQDFHDIAAVAREQRPSTLLHDTELLAYPIMLHPFSKYISAGGCVSALRSRRSLLWATLDLVVLTQWPKSRKGSLSPHLVLYPS